MAPKPLEDLRAHVERVQSEYEDPGERDRALATVEGELTGLLGTVRTYRNDAQLQQGADERDGGGTGSGRNGEQTATPPEAPESS